MTPPRVLKKAAKGDQYGQRTLYEKVYGIGFSFWEMKRQG